MKTRLNRLLIASQKAGSASDYARRDQSGTDGASLRAASQSPRQEIEMDIAQSGRPSNPVTMPSYLRRADSLE